MTQAICSTAGCNGALRARGLCNNCYKRARRSGALERVRAVNAGKSCAVATCQAPAYGRGWCRRHFLRWYKNGTVDDPPSRRQQCTVDQCEQDGHAQGLCMKHYYRAKRNGGDPDLLRRTPKGQGSTDALGYVTATRHGHPLARPHGRVFLHRVVLYEKLGPGTHPCHWCGVQLTWGPDLTVDHVDWNPSNNDPSNLVPACKSCNSKRQKRVGYPDERRGVKNGG